MIRQPADTKNAHAPDTFRLNAYRVLRLPASASAADIHRAAASMRRAVTFGVPTMSEIDIPELGALTRSDGEILAALDRLADPVQRITDRLFWFCQLPTSYGAQLTTDAMALTEHDRVLQVQFAAMRGGLDANGLATWLKALRGWHTLSRDESYWFLTLIFEDYGSLEAPATTEEIEALRGDAVRIAAEPLMIGARAAVDAGDKETVRRVIAVLSLLTDTGPWASAFINELEKLSTPDAEHVGRVLAWAEPAWPTLRQPGRIL
jgi:hypothetical protein